MSLEMAQKVIVPQKKIMSRSFLNSGTLIVSESLWTLLAVMKVSTFQYILQYKIIETQWGILTQRS